MSIDVAALTPDDLNALRDAILKHGGLDPQGRSPQRPRQLTNLNLTPTATDPRPTFFWSAEAPRDGSDTSKTTLYPRLMWHGKTGVEITVGSPKTEADRKLEGYILTPPANAEQPEPFDVVAAQIEGLSEKDRALLSKSYQQDRLQKIQSALADLPDDQIAALLERMNKDGAK